MRTMSDKMWQDLFFSIRLKDAMSVDLPIQEKVRVTDDSLRRRNICDDVRLIDVVREYT